MKITNYNLLFSGGLEGNLGLLIFSVFLLLLPNLCLMFKAIKIQFYFLKFLQYPGLLIFSFFLFVFFFRQDRWHSAEWKDNYIQFALVASCISNAFSLFLIRKTQTALMIVVPFFVLVGLGIYFVI